MKATGRDARQLRSGGRLTSACGGPVRGERVERDRGGCGRWVGIFYGRLCSRVIGKTRFIKNNMTRGDDLAGGQVETPIAFLLAWIADEHASGGAGREFVRRGG